MLQNAYFLTKFGADTAENEQHFAEVLPKTGNYPTGPVPIGIDAAAPPCGPECDRKCNFGFGKLRLGGSRVRPQVRLQAAKQGSRCIVSVQLLNFRLPAMISEDFVRILQGSRASEKS